MANQSPQRQGQRSDEAFGARRAALSAMLMLLLVLLILLLIAAATERTDILKFAGMLLAPGSVLAFEPRLNGILLADQGTKAGPAAIFPASIDSRFRAYYDTCGGVAVFGLPISPAITVNGRVVQWFERARLELAPEAKLGVQQGRIGAEYLATMAFPRQAAFGDRPDARYFGQTGHAIVAPFLAFWQQIGGVDALGYPLSEQLQEIQPNGRILTVQYFERGRLEIHPEHAGTSSAIQIGLVGRALYLAEAQPNIITPVQPTPVP